MTTDTEMANAAAISGLGRLPIDQAIVRSVRGWEIIRFTEGWHDNERIALFATFDELLWALEEIP